MLNLYQIQTLFAGYLSQHAFAKEPKELYEPINYILELGGKRLRPALALMSAQVFDASPKDALPVAYAVEIFHNFSLVHDDIMDQAPLRRGKPTVHHQYNTNTGILSGDVMLIYAYEYLLRVESQIIHSQLISVFNQVAIEVCEGQQMDMNFEHRQDVTIPEYLKMIEYKTAALIGGALEMGALVGGADSQDAKHLAAFGRNAGIAFQLQDDYLDVFGDPAKVGKKLGGDIVQNKKTYLILSALAAADAETNRRLLKLMTTHPDDEQAKIAQVIDILKQLAIPEKLEAAKADFMRKAYNHLQEVQGNAEAKEMLRGLADQLAARDY